MPEPDWKIELRGVVDAWVTGGDIVKDAAFERVMVHIEAAYQRGLDAGRSQTGYTTRRKRKGEEPWTDAPSAGSPSPASTTEGGR